MTAAPATLRRLQTEGVPSPVGTGTRGLRFTWVADLATSGYEVAVLDPADGAVVWSQEREHAPDVIAATYDGPELAAYTRYEWRVRARSGAGWSPWSHATFITGRPNGTDWPAAWVSASEPCGVARFVSRFTVAAADRHVLLHIAAGGYAAPRVNGALPSDAVLVPPWTDYTAREISGLLYPYRAEAHHCFRSVSYDISALVRAGENVCEIELAPGWFDQHVRDIEGTMSYGTPRLAAYVSTRCSPQDPPVLQCHRGEDWTWSTTELTEATIFGGAVRDVGSEPAPPRAVTSVSNPSAPDVRAALGPFDEAQSRTSFAESAPDSDLRWHIDAGQNFTGWVELDVHCEAPATIEITYAEERGPDGRLDYTSAGGTEQIQRDVHHVLAGRWTLAPRHTWHGFRYAEVQSNRPVQILETRITDVHPPFARIGTLSCADARVETIDAMFRTSFLSNFHSGVPSDCPHRERLGYTGDAHVVARAALWTFDLQRPYAEYVQTILDAQDRATGFVPHTAPFGGGGGGVGWGSAVAILPWEHYLAYGDPAVLEQSMAGIEAWIAYLRSRPTDPQRPLLIDREEEGSWFLGDWAWPGYTTGAPGVDARLVSTCFFAKCVRIASQAASVLGRQQDAERHQQLFSQILATLDDVFLSENRDQYGDGHGASAAFVLDLLDGDGAHARRLLHALVRQYETTRRIDTGIFGTPLLLEALSRAGRTDLGLELLFSADGPSFDRALAAGSTTLWENWDASDSHNHPMFGSVSAWFVERLVGLRAQPGRSRRDVLVCEPFAQYVLPSASMTYDAPRGETTVAWEQSLGQSGVVRLTVPPGAEMHLIDPTGSAPLVLSGGRHVVDWTRQGGYSVARDTEPAKIAE